jgi:hypothetical protein
MMDRRSRRRAQTISRGATAPPVADSPGVQPGIPIDAYGGATIDPTKNVLDLVEAAIRRVDDLRDSETRRVNEVMVMQARHTEEMAVLRSVHSRELAEAEAKRIDSIRLIDTQAVSTANEKATAQAAVLATQVSASAETLRALVATNAAAVATQLAQTITPITDRISGLERSMYEGKGKEAVADPAMAQLVQEVRALAQSRDAGQGRSAGGQTAMNWVITGITSAVAVLLLALRLAGH